MKLISMLTIFLLTCPPIWMFKGGPFSLSSHNDGITFSLKDFLLPNFSLGESLRYLNLDVTKVSGDGSGGG